MYSKGSPRPNAPELMPYYEELVKEFFPKPLNW
ncbi:MAG: inositol oxygenase family protein [Vicinamibacterales bacterium]